MATTKLNSHEFFFVVLDSSTYERASSFTFPLCIESISGFIRSGVDAWIVLTYVHLRNQGLPVKLANKFIPNAICVAHYDDIERCETASLSSFLVGIRADRDKTFLCELEIVQSPIQAANKRIFYIPHWSQPGLRPRELGPRAGLFNLTYFGTSQNLAERFKTEKFSNELNSLGVQLTINTSDWTDYQNTDAVLAIREGTQFFLGGKPATKLFNAWLAGCPAILSSEPSYQHHGAPGKTHLQAESPAEVLHALQNLQSSQENYENMVNAGRESVATLQADTIDAWRHLLLGDAVREYQIWATRSRVSKFIVFYIRSLRKKLYGRRYARWPIPARGRLHRVSLAARRVLWSIEDRYG